MTDLGQDHAVARSATDADTAQLLALGYSSQLERSISVWQNFALGFTYLSPVVGVYSVFNIGMAAGGPPMIWSYLIAAVGQFIVCLTFCEVVSQYPISGGLYPWARRLVGKRWAWMAGWIYSVALFVSVAAIAAAAAPFLASMLELTITPPVGAVIGIGLVMLATLINLSGSKVLARVAMFGFLCEIAGAIAVGCYLYVFEHHQSLTVILQSFGAEHGGSYLPAFAAAAVVGLFTCYGFEACGDMAEETPNPGLNVPRAMRNTIYVGMSASVFVCLALILALPDIGKVVGGGIPDPIGYVLTTAFGALGAKLVVAVVMVSFVSCLLSLQAAASRLVFAYGRDDMIVGGRFLAKLSPTTHVPTRALMVSGVIPAAILLLGLVFADIVATIVNFAVIGIYGAFQMIVIGAIWARLRGWKPTGQFQLGRFGWIVNVTGLVYGLCAIIDLVWPRTPTSPWYVNYALLVVLAGVIAIGIVYMLLVPRFELSTAPAGDAAAAS